MPTILITGSSGFIGGEAANAFRMLGWHVIGIGRRATDQPNYLQMDLANGRSPDLAAAVKQADVVLHAAARSSPWGTRKQFQIANLDVTSSLLEICQRADLTKLPKFIFLSSPSVYYQPRDQFNISEETPVAEFPVNEYAASKQRAEKIVRNYPGDWVILRPRAVYGKGDTVLFPRILKAARAGKLPLLVRQNAPAQCDLISVSNLVDCLVRAATSENIQGEFNLTDNDPQETLAFLLSVFDELDIPRPTRQVPVSKAMRAAKALEWIYGTFVPWIEPPVTRFGVHVFAYSKTFDVSKMLAAFGKPRKETRESVAEFVAWVKAESPY